MAIRNPKTEGNEGLVNFEPEEDETSRRIVSVSGVEYNVVSLDPYGLWVIRSTSGRLPDALKGQFTSPIEAEKEITKYRAKG